MVAAEARQRGTRGSYPRWERRHMLYMSDKSLNRSMLAYHIVVVLPYNSSVTLYRSWKAFRTLWAFGASSLSFVTTMRH